MVFWLFTDLNYLSAATSPLSTSQEYTFIYYKHFIPNYKGLNMLIKSFLRQNLKCNIDMLGTILNILTKIQK